jgi:hypothetical protein
MIRLPPRHDPPDAGIATAASRVPVRSRERDAIRNFRFGFR